MRHLPIPLLFILALSVFSCKEFYDEDFEEFREEQNRTGGGSSSTETSNFTTTLSSTDTSLTISGDASLEFRGENVTTSINITNIPQNFMQLTYTLVSVPCSNFSNVLAVDATSTRTYRVSETLSRDAFNLDVISTGATDTNLTGKSVLIRGFSNLVNSGTTGQTFINIACGELLESGTTTGNTTGTTTGGTTGATTGGTTGF